MSSTRTTAERQTGVAQSLDPALILAAIRAAGITDVITVPDTHQRSLLALLAEQPDLPLITVCTEDEVMAVNLGLYMGGRRPVMLIQNSGFYAALNTVRGLSLDAETPACLLIGEFSRDPSRAPAYQASRLVHMLEPTLDAWKIPSYRLDHEDDLGNVALAVEQSWLERGPVALLVGATTAEVS
jgi:sulfopyruvate decarboxylase subunit alpha